MSQALQPHTRQRVRERSDTRTIYVCQLCTRTRAIWPYTRRHTWLLPFGLTWSVDYVTPMVCTQCRVMRWPEAYQLGNGRRRFWKRVVAVWCGEPYPSIEPWVLRLVQWRAHQLGRRVP